MSKEAQNVEEVMELVKQLTSEDKARVLLQIAMMQDRYLKPEPIEHETPASEICDGMDSATPMDKASVIRWLALTLEGDLKAKRPHSQKLQSTVPNNRQAELPKLE